MQKMTKAKKDRAERKAYRALDAIQDLVDMGFGCDATERAFEKIRDILRKIEGTETK